MMRRIGWTCSAALGLMAGCGGLPARRPQPPVNESANILDTGPGARVSGQGAADIQLALGRAHEEGGQLAEAEGSYRSALKQDPKRGEVEARLAIVLDRQGKPAEADEHFARALKLRPNDPDLLCDRGYSLHIRGRAREAEESLRAALALDPKHARSHNNLGLVLAGRGESGAALAEFDRSGADPADSRANLALALALGGHLEASRDQYARTSTAQPASKPAEAARRGVLSALKARANPSADGLPPLPGSAAPALVAAAGSGPKAPAPATAARVDPAVLTTSATMSR